MSAPDFFTRYTSEFAQQAGASQANVDRHISAERLVAKAEYDLYQLRRELVDVLEIVEKLKAKSVGFKVLDQDLDTTKPHGKLMLSMLGACAEYERSMLRERQAEGIKRYQARLAREGRKPGPEPHGKEREIKKMRKSGKMIREIMAEMGVSKATVYRALDR